MDWNLKMNGKRVTWKIADVVAVVPSSEVPPPSVEDQTKLSEDEVGDDLGEYEDGEKDRKIFDQAGWKFIDAPAGDPTQGGVNLPGGGAVRQVFITESGDVLIGTDIATVQLNAATKLTPEAVRRVMAEDGLTILHQLSFAPHMYAVRLPSDRPMPEKIDELQAKTDRYVFAEPSLIQRISGRETVNDPHFGDQWQHANRVTANGGGGFGLHSVDAWYKTTGVSQEGPVRIAIIDNGMDIAHVDLKEAIIGGGFFRSDGPGTGTATFVRLTPGMSGFPYRGHGTFCLGMAGARRNNGTGGCGVAPGSHLIALACGLNQTGNQLTLSRSIEFAINPQAVDPGSTLDMGADIISCSLRVANALESVLEMAINYAASARQGLGIPIFWAVSNRNVAIANDPVCSLDNVIAVGRSNRSGLPDGSAFGPKLEFLAPGRDVLGPSVGQNNVFDSGTSFAAPLAAGVAALVLALHPHWSAEQVRQHLRDTCDKPNGQDRDDNFGFGRLNAHNAVL